MINKWKDLWFYYKVIAAIAILFAISGLYIYHMVTQTWERKVDYPFSYLFYQGNFFSFFTYQSNIIVGVWFLIAAIYHNKPNKFIDNQNIRMAITCYISVTCFIFLLVLAPLVLSTKESFYAGTVIGAIFFHIITPILMITYSLTHITPMKMTARQYYSKTFWLYLIYPFAYTLYLILRLIIYTNVSGLKDMPLILVYPYLPVLPLTNINITISDQQLTIILIACFFIITYLSFVLFNLLYFYSIKKLGQNQKKLKHKRKLKKTK